MVLGGERRLTALLVHFSSIRVGDGYMIESLKTSSDRGVAQSDEKKEHGLPLLFECLCLQSIQSIETREREGNEPSLSVLPSLHRRVYSRAALAAAAAGLRVTAPDMMCLKKGKRGRRRRKKKTKR